MRHSSNEIACVHQPEVSCTPIHLDLGRKSRVPIDSILRREHRLVQTANAVHIEMEKHTRG